MSVGYIAFLLLWVVVSLALLVPPLLRDDPESLASKHDWFPGPSTESGDDVTTADEPPTGRRDTLAITDGGYECRNCGATMDGTFVYCGECLTPRI